MVKKITTPVTTKKPVTKKPVSATKKPVEEKVKPKTLSQTLKELVETGVMTKGHATKIIENRAGEGLPPLPRDRNIRYTKAKYDEMLAYVCLGYTLSAICEDHRYPTRNTFFAWTREHGRQEDYDQAIRIRADKSFDEMITIADTPLIGERIKKGPKGIEISLGDMVERSRLMISTRQWCLARMDPNRFADRLHQEITGKDGKDLENGVTLNFVGVEPKDKGKVDG